MAINRDDLLSEVALNEIVDLVELLESTVKEQAEEITKLKDVVFNGAIPTKWDSFVSDLQTLSASSFNSAYTEKDLVEVANERPLLPDWLKSTAGAKKLKIKWYQDNKETIEQY